MDVTNPGLVSVADQTYGNPDPNSGPALLTPEQLDVLTAAGNQGYPPAGNGVDSSVFPTPANVVVTGANQVGNVANVPTPAATEVNLDTVVIGQGSWQDTPDGKKFVPPSDFIIVGPAESFQTNVTESTTVTRTVTAVYDADSLYNAPTSTTTRFMLVVGLPNFTSYPVTVLGRQITFTDDTITVDNQGANRIITGFSTNYVVIDRYDPTEDDGNVASMDIPQVGDTFILDIQRAGSEQVNTKSLPSTDVFIFPPPPTFVPDPPQALQDLGEVDVSTGPQPGTPIITSGTAAPTAVNVYVADQSTSVGLPTNVNI
jgi:hypothetical protein